MKILVLGFVLGTSLALAGTPTVKTEWTRFAHECAEMTLASEEVVTFKKVLEPRQLELNAAAILSRDLPLEESVELIDFGDTEDGFADLISSEEKEACEQKAQKLAPKGVLVKGISGCTSKDECGSVFLIQEPLPQGKGVKVKVLKGYSST